MSEKQRNFGNSPTLNRMHAVRAGHDFKNHGLAKSPLAVGYPGNAATGFDLLRVFIHQLEPVAAALVEAARGDVGGGDAGETLEASRQCGERFDLILFDLTASDDPACAHLHAPPFLNACADRLMPGGRLHVQLGSPFYQPETVAALHRRLSAVFPYVRPALISVPLYGGPWLLAAASVEALPETSEAQLAQRLAERAIPPLRYYNPALHRASFALPNYVHTLLAS